MPKWLLSALKVQSVIKHEFHFVSIISITFYEAFKWKFIINFQLDVGV